MPKGRWKAPRMGRASPAAKKAMRKAYKRCRDANPREARVVKQFCALRSWREVKKNFEKRGGKWVRKRRK